MFPGARGSVRARCADESPRGALAGYRLGPRLLRVDPEDVDRLLVRVTAVER